MSQPQLLKIALDKKDVVYTPDWVAKDMVEYFKPTGKILEPCSGDGSFLNYLPSAEWCEIEKGRDFFKWDKKVDWIIGNPPYKQFDNFLQHSFSLAENIVFLIPGDKPFNSMARLRMVNSFGGIAAARFYCDGPQMDMPEIHRPMAAFHFKKYCTDGMNTTIYGFSKTVI